MDETHEITCSVVMHLFGIFGNFYWWVLAADVLMLSVAATVDLAFILCNTVQFLICYVFDPVFLYVRRVSLEIFTFKVMNIAASVVYIKFWTI